MPENKKEYSVSLSELSKLYKIDKGVLKAIIKKVSKKSKKKKAKRAKAKSQTIKFDKKKEQEDNTIRYMYGPTPFPTNNNNSNITIRDGQIMSEQINDLKANNKLLMTDVLPNLVNYSDTKTLDFYNKIDNKVNTLASSAKQNLNYLLDDVGDWKETRKLVDQVKADQKKYENNQLANIPNTFDIRDLISSTNTNFYNNNNEQVQVNEPVNEAVVNENKVDYDNISDISNESDEYEFTEDSSFYSGVDVVVHNQTFNDEAEDETQKQTRDQVDKSDNKAVDMFVSDDENPVFTPVKTKTETESKKVVPTPQSKNNNPNQYIDYRSEYKRYLNGAKDTLYSKYKINDGEHGTAFRYRAEYFYNKANGLYVTESAKSKHDTAYRNYLRNNPLI